MSAQGTFDKLNDALFEQLGRLSSAQGDDVEAEIRRSNAVAQLASNINNNMANAVKVANILAMEGADVAGMGRMLPGMLDAPPALAEPNWEVVDPFIEANAERHTATYIADRLRAQGVDVTAQVVRRRCRELGVECADISSGTNWMEAQDRSFASRAGGGA